MPSTPQAVLGKVLLRARETLHRSPEQVGALVGISGRTIRRLEDGEAERPRRVTLEALAGFYGLNPDAIGELAELDASGDELLSTVRGQATTALGPQVVQALEGVEDEAVELAMRLARASLSPADGKTQFVISFLRDVRATPPRERSDAVDAFVHFLALDRPRRALAGQLLRELHQAQGPEHGSDAPGKA